MQTFLPGGRLRRQRPAAGLPAAGQAAGGDPADPAGARAARLRLGQPPRRPHVARAHAGAGRLRAGDGPGLAGARASPTPPTTPDRRVRARRRRRGRRTSWPRAGLLPSWLGDEALHRSHRSNLIAKDPDFYRPRFAERFGAEPDDLPYVWPGPDDVPPAPPRPRACRVWVVRPRDARRAGRLPGRRGGRAGHPVGDRRRRHRARRRPSCGRCRRSCPDGGPAKDLRQLSAFLDEIAPGRPGRRCRSSTAPGCCSARWSGTTCSRAASCCRTAGRPAGTGSCRGRRPARRPPCRTRGRCSGSSSTRRRSV